MSDEDVIIEDEPDVAPSDHPTVLTNNNTPFFWSLVNYVWTFVEGNGYLCIIGVVVAYYVYQKSVSYLEEKVKKNRNDVQSNLSPEEQMNRMEAVRRAREKLQAEVDKASAIEAEKIKEREERQRKEKIEDWERHKRGEGYKSKITGAGSSTLKKDNFSHLMGSGSSGGFKSSRPGPSRGGGG